MPTVSSSRFMARPMAPFSNSTSSEDMHSERPCTRAMPSPASTTVPTLTAELSVPNCSICCLRIAVISSALTAIGVPPFVLPLPSPGGGGTAFDLLSKGRSLDQRLSQRVQLAAHTGVDQPVAYLHNDAAQQL